MPAGGARPNTGGHRPGAGRKKGTKNKSTIEREKEEAKKALAQQAAIDLARGRGGKIATEVIDDFMRLFVGLAARHQTWPAEAGVNPHENPKLFREYAKLAVQCATELANYQQPKFKAMVVAMAQPGMGIDMPGAALPPPQAVPPADGEGTSEPGNVVVSMNDAAALTKVYQQRMKRFG